jgi:hypothetical protein
MKLRPARTVPEWCGGQAMEECHLASAREIGGDDGGLRSALRQARLAEAAHFEAALDLRDSKTIRLQLLKDDLMPAVVAAADAAELFDLALVPGEPPRLWIDLVTFVLMEPDHRTYRLLQDRQSSREVLFESADRAAMAAEVRHHMAHRIVARERMVVANVPPPPLPGYSVASLLLAWLAGLALGALALMAAVIHLGKPSL